MYLNLFVMLGVLAATPAIARRAAGLRRHALFWPVTLMLAWTLVATGAGPWFPDTPTRLFHVVRVALVLAMALVLEPPEARAGLAGFIVAALLAAMVVAIHHVWGLPAWEIWGSLLMSRNNFSSGNMISMATASGLCFYLAISGRLARTDGWVALAAALALGLTVALHAVSRNSQLLLAVLLLAAVWHRYRSWRSLMAGALLGLAVAAAIWNFSPTTKSRFAELAASLQQATSAADYGTSGGIRLRMYQEALQGMLEHPFLGVGVGSWLPNWNAAWMAMDVPVTPELKLQFSTINNPHNDFLLAGSETGVLGMAILVWLLAAGIRQGWRQRSASGGMVVVLGVALFFTALVNAPFRDAALGTTLLWLFGASLAAQRRPGDA